MPDSDYLESLTQITDRQVILYATSWDAVAPIAQHRCLPVDRPYLPLRTLRGAKCPQTRASAPAGQSWGGMLALEHVLTGVSGITSLTLASTMAGTDDWTAAVGAQRAALPDQRPHGARSARGRRHDRLSRVRRGCPRVLPGARVPDLAVPRRVARGDKIAAFALSEPDAGSDVGAMQTKAAKE